MSRRLAYGVLGGIVAGFLLIAAVVLTRPHVFRGSIIEPPVAATEFSLPHGSSDSFSLRDQRGKLVVLFFGYTTCPDVCPTTLSEMKLVQKRLGAAAGDLRVVMISVDPERDLPEKVAQYAASFHPDFIGLSGSEGELEPIWKGYGVYREKRQSESASGYLVDHSGFLYVIDRQGNLRETFAFGTPVDDIVADVGYLLKER